MESQKYQDVIQDLLDCVKSCEECVIDSISGSYPQKMDRCIRLARDCKDVCSLQAKYLSRNSPIAPNLMSLCVEICMLCAEECLKHPQSKECKDCHKACLKCAETCKKQIAELVS
jgi:hypothetical protein